MSENNKYKKTLQEIHGISEPEMINTAAISRIKEKRKLHLTANEFIQKISEGNKTALSQAITLVESTIPADQLKAAAIIEGCLPLANKSIRIGITGAPGVGKSSLIESLGLLLCQGNKKLAVLAIDPSSTLTQGSILGDKTRMQELSKNINAFIRPSPSGNHLGGVARMTRETIILCEAAGYDTVFIETVGVGQSETTVRNMVDYFMLLQLTGAGDSLQGIKRGIIELSDAIVVTKADGQNSKLAMQTKSEFAMALSLFPKNESGIDPIVTACSVFDQQSISRLWSVVLEKISTMKSNGYFESQRKSQNKNWLLETINNQLLQNFYDDPTIIQKLEATIKRVQEDKSSPFTSAQEILQDFYARKFD